MKLNLLAINVGNTRAQVGAFIDGELGATAKLDGKADAATLAASLAETAAALREQEPWLVVVGSVNDPLAERLIEATRKLTPDAVYRVERDVTIPIGRQLDRESIIGEDRLLTAAAAYDRIKEACIIVDAGTAVTVDFVDGDGTFHGGAILPGPRMMLQAMHDHTAQLPEIVLARPEESIGHNTAQAMLGGVYHGIRGAVRELVEKYAEHYGAYPKVIATGGDAELLFSDYELIDAVVPDLALHGLAATARIAMEQENA